MIPFCPLCDCIVLTNNKRAYVDFEDRHRIGLKGWKAKKSRGGWYAFKKARHGYLTQYVYMHRLIMNCPRGLIVHHKNRNTLDNRKSNLIIMTPEEHEHISRNLRIAKKINNFP